MILTCIYCGKLFFLKTWIFQVERAGIEKNLTLLQPLVYRTKMDPDSKLPGNHINPHQVHQNFEIL